MPGIGQHIIQASRRNTDVLPRKDRTGQPPVFHIDTIYFSCGVRAQVRAKRLNNLILREKNAFKAYPQNIACQLHAIMQAPVRTHRNNRLQGLRPGRDKVSITFARLVTHGTPFNSPRGYRYTATSPVCFPKTGTDRESTVWPGQRTSSVPLWAYFPKSRIGHSTVTDTARAPEPCTKNMAQREKAGRIPTGLPSQNTFVQSKVLLQW